MSTTNTTSNAPLFYFNGHVIQATYSFSAYNSNVAKPKKTNKVWLDMEFKHPVNEEAVKVRSAKSALILSQPREVIDAIAQRDVRDFLSVCL